MQLALCLRCTLVLRSVALRLMLCLPQIPCINAIGRASSRAEDLSTLAAELCNLGMYVQHAPLVRKAVQLSLEGAGAMSARHLASLAQACGVLGNIRKADMMVRPHAPAYFLCHRSPALSLHTLCVEAPWLSADACPHSAGVAQQ